MWYDGKDTATLFDAVSGGSTPSAGGNVKRWLDKSGNGWHATEGTNFPSFVSGGGVLFSNTMALTTGAITQTLPVMTSFAVFKMTGSSTSTFHRFWDRNGTRNHYTEYGALKQARASARSTPTTGTITSRSGLTDSVALNTTYISTVTWAGGADGTDFSLRLQGSPDNGTTSGTGATFASDTGNAITIGNRPALDRGMLGNIYEILIFRRVLTTQEIETVEAYLAAKWGTTAPEFSSSSSSSPSSNSSSSSSSSSPSSNSSSSSSSSSPSSNSSSFSSPSSLSLNSSSSSSLSPGNSSHSSNSSSSSSNSSSSSSSVMLPNTLRENVGNSVLVTGAYATDIDATNAPTDQATNAVAVTGAYATDIDPTTVNEDVGNTVTVTGVYA